MNKKYFYQILILILINFLIHVAFLNLPIHWDEDAYFSGVFEIYENNLNPFVEFWSYKPPFMFEITAVLFKLFGPSRVWGRLVTLIFSCLSLLFTYLLGENLFNKRVGFLSALLLFFFPLFMAQSFLFQAAVPLTALTLIVFYFYFLNKKFLYFIFASCLVLTKEPAIFIIVLLAFFDFWQSLSKKRSLTEVLKNNFFLLSPLVFFILWLFLNKKILGWYLWPYNVSYFSLDQPHFQHLKYHLSDIFQDYFLWVIFSLLFSGFIFSFGWKKLKAHFLKKEIIFFCFIFLFFLTFFSWGAFRIRYLLFIYPLIFLSFTWLLEVIFKYKRDLATAVIVFLCLGFSIYNFSNALLVQKLPSWTGERDLSLLRLIYYRRQIAQKIVQSLPKKGVIIANWPYLNILRKPFFGYVEKERDVFSCRTNREKEKVKLFLLNEKYNKDVFLIIFSEQQDNLCFNKKNFYWIKNIQSEYYPNLKPVRIYKLRENERID